MKPFRCAVLIGCAAALAVTLGACRPEEQGRILSYQKGVYLGKADSPLTAKARSAARDRARYQGGLNVIATGRPGRVAPRSSVRPPGALRRRGRGQSYN
ncbi:MAG: hypothetical protein QGF09_13150 [Rhodospirillales bacterium]|nr:hypothetical protein [Rhodospirillales bacterium]